ncbi:MAG: CARDB domain-containing protein [Myxococcota bacterium]
MTFLLALAAAPAWSAPDLLVESITTGCTGSGGTPNLYVTVYNAGNSTASAFYVDLFRDELTPPPIGSYGEKYKQVSSLAAGTRKLLVFPYTAADQLWTGWVDVLVDTDEWITESNEGNNHRDAYLQLPDCSFN